MALFSSKKSTTNYSTTNNLTDQSANAAEGAVAVGAGANVNIVTADAEIARGAFDTAQISTLAAKETAGLALAANANTTGLALAANQNVSLASLGAQERTAGLSIAAQNQLAGLAIQSSSDLAKFTGNTIAGFAEVASRERQDVLEQTNTALLSSRGAADKFADLASAALERSQTPDSQITKTLLYVAGAVAAIFALSLATRRRAA